MRKQILAATLAMILCPGGPPAHAYDLTITGGTVHGPGPMPDTPLPEGKLGSIALDNELGGASEFFNNGAEPPNVPGEMEIYGHLGGRLSNGAPFNEHVYGGVVSIGQGALKMLSVIASDGEMKGRETYRLNERLNWIIHTDLALDAGFPQGLVISRNITITSGVLLVAPSLQTEGGIKGGMDEAGSLPSGAPIYGMLGDLDNRGFLDGRIVGVGRVPLGFMFVPGSPLVMQRNFKSNIPVTREEAGILTFAGLANLRDILAVARDGNPAARSYVLAHVWFYFDDFAARARSAQSHLSAAGPAHSGQAALAAQIEAVLKQGSRDAGAWITAGAIPEANMTAIEVLLRKIDQITPALRAELHFTQVGG
jgi:hypothetical protein